MRSALVALGLLICTLALAQEGEGNLLKDPGFETAPAKSAY